MTQEELNSTTAYMDMVRNHREKAFDEGVEAMREILLSGDIPFMERTPENPYKIKEKEQNYEKS